MCSVYSESFYSVKDLSTPINILSNIVTSILSLLLLSVFFLYSPFQVMETLMRRTAMQQRNEINCKTGFYRAELQIVPLVREHQQFQGM